MESTWILTANGGHAHVYSITNTSPPLKHVKTLDNPNASSQTTETESDRLGQRAASKSKHSVGQPTQPSGYEPHQSPAEHQAELLARRVVDFLLQSHQQGEFEKIIVTATPEFLGTLRSLMDASVKNCIVSEIDKDYTHYQGKELIELINARRNAA